MVILSFTYMNFAGLLLEPIHLNGFTLRHGVHFVPEF